MSVNLSVGEEVWRYVTECIESDVLRPLIGQVLVGAETRPEDLEDGLVLLHCGDGHRAPRFIGDMSLITKCPHAIALNGGALWLDPEFRDPMFMEEEQLVIRKFVLVQLVESMIIKKTNRCGLVGHIDCGKAAHHCIAPPRLYESIIRAKRFVKENYQAVVEAIYRQQSFSDDQLRCLRYPLKVATIIHVHHDEDLHERFLNTKHGNFIHLRPAA